MALKKFLKPTRGKIVVLIILFLLAICVSILVARSRVEVQKGIGSELKVKIFEGAETVLLYPCYLIARYIIAPRISPRGISLDIIYTPSTLGALILLIPLVVYWYLISCLIIFIYERLKERTRKK